MYSYRKKRVTFKLLIHSSNGWDKGRLKLRDWNSISVSHVGGSEPNTLGHLLLLSQTGTGLEVELPKTKSKPTWAAGISGLTHNLTMPTLVNQFLTKSNNSNEGKKLFATNHVGTAIISHLHIKITFASICILKSKSLSTNIKAKA